MTSFPGQAARVRDADLPVRRRLLALRECALHFAPYGFRATWHHLIVSAGMPVRLDDDPDSLLRAVDELEEARQVWLGEMLAFAARRREEKAAGRRSARRDDAWHAWPGWLAFCPDPETHPRGRLAAVVRQLIAAYRSGPLDVRVCPACHARRSSLPCPRCGVYPWHPDGIRPPGPPDTSLPWPLIWQRLVRRETTVGGGLVGQFRVEYTPTSQDQRFGIFQLYVRGVPLGDGTTTALYPHVVDMRALREAAELPASWGPRPLILGDTFDHATMTLAATDEALVFTVATNPEWGAPPPWAPPVGRTLRLSVRRSEVVKAWREAEPRFRLVLTRRPPII